MAADAFQDSLTSLLDAAHGRTMREIRVAAPAAVTRYDATRQVVDVQPQLADYFWTDTDDVEQVFGGVVPNVPVVFPGAGGFRLTFPVQVGDTVLLVFADRSLDAWQDQGGKRAPNDLRRHHISDAVAIPGLHPNPKAWTGASTSNMTLGKDGGPQVTISPSDIELGGTDETVACAGKVATELNRLWTALETHVHAVPGVTTGAGATTSSPTVTAGTAGSVASSLVKVKS